MVHPPYLPPHNDPNKYTLVLDLDETLVHYYEIGSQGTFNVRPGVDIFLKEMAELYEVVIFTAAMQDVSFSYSFILTLYSMLIGSSTRSINRNTLPTGYTGSMH